MKFQYVPFKAMQVNKKILEPKMVGGQLIHSERVSAGPQLQQSSVSVSPLRVNPERKTLEPCLGFME